jgi:hypothetical protein
MGAIYDVILLWKDLIIKIFSEYPLAGAIVTLAAVGAFWVLEHSWRKSKTTTNVLLVLLAWAIAVPVLGLGIVILANVWGFLEVTVPIVKDVVTSLYAIYEKHPVLFLIICSLGFPAYFAWKWRFADTFPRPRLRKVAVGAVVVLALYFAGPIAGLFDDGKSINEAEKTPSKPKIVPTAAKNETTDAPPLVPAKGNDGTPKLAE